MDYLCRTFAGKLGWMKSWELLIMNQRWATANYELRISNYEIKRINKFIEDIEKERRRTTKG